MHSKMMLPIELTKILYQSWSGEISISSQDSEIYGRCLNGLGSVTFKNSNKYEGNFYNGLLCGKGKFTWANGIVYEGEFTDNRITGKGVYRWPDGSVYEGQTRDGLRHGHGKYTINDAVYQGGWLQGKKHGEGKIIFKSGSIFEGSFKGDMKDGFGKMYYYPSGNYFEGLWKEDVKEGYGTMNWCDIREKYAGQWKNNQQHGWGVHVWLESKGQGKYLRNMYQGNWAKGLREGYGVFYYANGAKYEGFWKDNMKEGFAFYTNENGNISLTLFCKDRMIKQNSKLAVTAPISAPLTTSGPLGKTTLKIEAQDPKKTKKEIEVNYYSQCLDISNIYLPSRPNLQQLYNYLLRNNSQLKSWYKGAATFYDQQSEYSFCLNFEGAWKMIRSLKILGDFSLAVFNRGLNCCNPDIEALLAIIERAPEENVKYEDVYYQVLGNAIGGMEEEILSKCIAKSQKKISAIQRDQETGTKALKLPFRAYLVHDRERNILFREFVQLLVWMATCLEPHPDKPQKSVEKLINKITPFLETISKASKATTADTVSENRSSVSKAEKNISPFFRTVNTDLLNKLQKDSSPGIAKHDITLTIRELIGIGRVDKVFGEAEYILLEKVLEKYFDNDVLTRERNHNWEGSSIPHKVLNVLNYELIEFEFIQLLYILLIKKLPNHKETEENKRKYQEYAMQLMQSRMTQDRKQKQRKEYLNEARFITSDKNKLRTQLQARRVHMEQQKRKMEEKLKELAREKEQLALMAREDTDVKDVEFDEEQSEFEI